MTVPSIFPALSIATCRHLKPQKKKKKVRSRNDPLYHPAQNFPDFSFTKAIFVIFAIFLYHPDYHLIFFFQLLNF